MRPLMDILMILLLTPIVSAYENRYSNYSDPYMDLGWILFFVLLLVIGFAISRLCSNSNRIVDIYHPRQNYEQYDHTRYDHAPVYTQVPSYIPPSSLYSYNPFGTSYTQPTVSRIVTTTTVNNEGSTNPTPTISTTSGGTRRRQSTSYTQSIPSTPAMASQTYNTAVNSIFSLSFS